MWAASSIARATGRELVERAADRGPLTIGTLVSCGTLANICVHYTAASAALRWCDVVIPRDATSALEPWTPSPRCARQPSVFAGRLTTADCVRVPPSPATEPEQSQYDITRGR